MREGGVIAYPTDSCYALGCQLGNADGITRIRSIRHLDDRHHLTLVCQNFAQLGQFAYLANPVFRAIKAATPGSYTFILPATKEVPRRYPAPTPCRCCLPGGQRALVAWPGRCPGRGGGPGVVPVGCDRSRQRLGAPAARQVLVMLAVLLRGLR